MSVCDKKFEDYYKRYYSNVYYFFLYRGVAKEDAKDLAHDTFLRIYRHWEDFRGDTSFSKWADIVAKSVWCNYIRTKKTQKREAILLSLDNLDLTKEPENVSRPHADKAAIRKEHLDMLRHAVKELPDRTRAVVVLRTYHDLRFSEIATIMGVSEETVKSQCSQGKKKLEKLLAKQFDNILP